MSDRSYTLRDYTGAMEEHSSKSYSLSSYFNNGGEKHVKLKAPAGVLLGNDRVIVSTI